MVERRERRERERERGERGRERERDSGITTPHSTNNPIS